MSDKILIFGANGQVGRALHDLLGDKAVVLSHNQADFAKPALLPDVLEAHMPRAVINASAYTQVDKAEEEESLAYMVNAQAPAIIAKWCQEHAVPYVHYSTDYVFDGSGTKPWKESDICAPLNAYGRTKRAGEERLLQVGGKFLLFRISWVFDAYGRNFFNTMLRLMQEREELNVVDDQHGAPCYAPHIARATLDALDKVNSMPNFPSGIYHMCNGGETTWHGFAQAIREEAIKAGFEIKCERVKGIPTSAYPTPAKRPANSRLDCTLAQTILGLKLPSWQEGLTACMQVKREITRHSH